MDSLIMVGQHIVYSLIAIGFMYGIKYFDDKRTSFDEDKLIIQDNNIAMALRRASIYIALAIAMTGALSGPNRSFLSDIGSLLLDGVIASAALLVAFFVNDLVMLRSVDNDEAIKDNNVPAAIVEAGSYIATGFILNGSFSGENGGIASAIVFFILGQIALVALYYAYDFFTGFDFDREVGINRNMAAAIAISGTLMALGTILRSSLTGPFTGWANDIASFAVATVEGIGMLVLFRFLLYWLFLPSKTFVRGVRVCEGDTASLLLVQGVLNAMAMIIATMI